MRGKEHPHFLQDVTLRGRGSGRDLYVALASVTKDQLRASCFTFSTVILSEANLRSSFWLFNSSFSFSCLLEYNIVCVSRPRKWETAHVCVANTEFTDARKESRAATLNSRLLIHLASPARLEPSGDIEEYLWKIEGDRESWGNH